MMLNCLGSILLLVAFPAISETAKGGDFCGLAKPEHSKTCISIRLPWKLEPIYFCTGKDELKYEKKCPETPKCYQTLWTNKTLLVATPWDCCPLASVPSDCENIICPAKPFNRTCITLKEKHTSGCCLTYFCEPDAEVEETCNFKIIDPSCHNPPSKKENCIGFVDPFGCCTKYQCDGETKVGKCPTHSPITNAFSNRNTFMDKNYKNLHKVHPTPSILQSKFSTSFPKLIQSIPCIGDYNCPGDMKCCEATFPSFFIPTAKPYPKSSIDTMSPSQKNFVYEDVELPIIPSLYNTNAKYGYCTRPVKPQNKNGKTVTTSSNIEETTENLSSER